MSKKELRRFIHSLLATLAAAATWYVVQQLRAPIPVPPPPLKGTP